MPRLKNIHRDQKSDSDGVGARVGGRLKKAKIVFDPSVHNLPRKVTRSLSTYSEPPTKVANNMPDSPKADKQSSSPPQPELEINTAYCCMICGKVGMKKSSKLIACKDCNYKVHSACLKISFLNSSLLEEHWRCDNCRMCAVCYETSEVGPLVSCRICVDAYHFSCHTPRIPRNVNKTKWECSKCQSIEKVASIKSVRDTDQYIGNNFNNINQIETEKLTKKTDEVKSSLRQTFPDVSDWTSDRVAKYFEAEFPWEANKFREHDIDGASLLLLKRSDIINGLSLKLGPAIRLYTRIVQLQAKSGDPLLTWM